MRYGDGSRDVIYRSRRRQTIDGAADCEPRSPADDSHRAFDLPARRSASNSGGVAAVRGAPGAVRAGSASVGPIGADFHRAMVATAPGWLGSRVVSVLDSGAEGPGFKSQPRRCRVTVLGKLFTPTVPLFTKQQNW